MAYSLKENDAFLRQWPRAAGFFYSLLVSSTEGPDRLCLPYLAGTFHN